MLIEIGFIHNKIIPETYIETYIDIQPTAPQPLPPEDVKKYLKIFLRKLKEWRSRKLLNYMTYPSGNGYGFDVGLMQL